MYLWVVSCGQAMLDSETLHEFLIELVAKLLSLVRGQDLWQAHAHEDLKEIILVNMNVLQYLNINTTLK